MLLTLQDDVSVTVRTDDDSDALFYQVCEDNPGLKIEQASSGEVIIMSPAGNRSSNRNGKILRQLGNWAKEDGRGELFDSDTAFRLPDGSKLGPDAAWVSSERLSPFMDLEDDDFYPLTPEFVIELKSKTDRIKKLKRKMEDWMRNGVQLGWLIDADERTVWIYRPGAEPEELLSPTVVRGDGPVIGFELAMDEIYRGFKR